MKIRNEVHTRSRFAYLEAEKYYKKVGNVMQSGNILICKAQIKFQQARRIYIHYTNEFQIAQGLPLTN